MKRSKKRGFTMVELIIVISVVVSMTYISLLAGQRLLKAANVARIISEMKHFSSGIIGFYQLRGYYPGDLNSTGMQASLSSSTILYNLNNVKDNCPGLTKCKPATGHISGMKSIIAFQQMAKLEFITSQIDLTKTIQTSGGCPSSASENLFTLRNSMIPGSSYSREIGWMIGRDFSGITELLSPKNSIIYDSSIYNNFDGKIRLILSNLSSYSGTMASCDIDVANTNSLFFGSGALSPNYAEDIDIKIDDGKPSSGRVVSENDTNGNGCTDTSATILSRKYKDSREEDPKKMCIMTFIV
ncbi:type II secretion system protein [Candidatus Deianiraea vastatrix]|uniref:PulG/PilA-like type II secretion/type IV pilus pilin n=1 Tax=Candidatus Deianiraea vastatrix TaxID=2163644 RepID=A0A5B8XCE2_9RICK|nr:type II secretion system protein [Candidatus Deianiraea vastatrix]QED22930.1 Putative PulG/PilA-like type II secretion/type IV pilus pilin [Candidatus Deianiraea vastatrix]